MVTNFLQETEYALYLAHHHTWKNITFIRNATGYIDMATFTKLAQDIWYDNESELTQIDPTLQIVGRGFWLEREKRPDGKEGWVYYRSPSTPTKIEPIPRLTVGPNTLPPYERPIIGFPHSGNYIEPGRGVNSDDTKRDQTGKFSAKDFKGVSFRDG